jgi:hypothetical protein
MLSYAAHKTHRSIVATHVVKKRSWAPKVSKKMHGLFINSMGFFNFLMGRTGKEKIAKFCGR